ncbi:MAG: TlpA family protein disulfide reductase [Candidatus Hodarchaeales archaeon]
MKNKTRMFMVYFILVFSISTSSEIVLANVKAPSINSFNFTHIDGSIRALSEYTDKPILIEWGASWCSTCKANLKVMDDLYPSYKNRVHFLSISYGGSGDMISDITSSAYMGDYEWDFGLDHTNVANTLNVRNGYMTLLSPELEISNNWAGLIEFKKDELTSAMDTLILLNSDSSIVSSSLSSSSTPTETDDIPAFEILITLFILLSGGLTYAFLRQRQTGVNKTSEIVEKSSIKQQEKLQALKQVLVKKEGEEKQSRHPSRRKR